tara:strand:+ start:101003 stop:102178 length:1176 start_codon:yes stop_codon:yes gene_type:complete
LDSNKIVFGIRSEVYSNSNSLTAAFLNKSLYGGFITADDKNQIFKRSREANNAINLLNNSVFYAQRIDTLFGKKKTNLGFFVNAADRQENLALFSKNAMQVILNGNKQFAGESTQLVPMEFKQFHYSQFQLGFTKSYATDNYFSLGVSFLYGQANRMGRANRFDLITSETGERISVDAEILYQETDPNHSNFMQYNGAGASIDFVGKFKVNLLRDSTNQANFHFSVKDIGFINWHATSRQTVVDTFYSYTGVQIENVFDPNSKITGDNPGAILDSVAVKSTTAYQTAIPITIHFYLTQNWRKWVFTIGGAHRLNAFYYPYFYGKGGYKFTNHWTAFGQINYGGYGKLGTGVEFTYEAKQYNFKLGSSNVEGFISPNTASGQSIYVLLSYKL